MDNRFKGTVYEELATRYLENMGYQILEKNFRGKSSEIDIIAKDKEYYVFVEVKYRKDGSPEYPLCAVDQRKQQKIRKAALEYLCRHRITESPCRFDVCGFYGEEIIFIKNAF